MRYSGCKSTGVTAGAFGVFASLLAMMFVPIGWTGAVVGPSLPIMKPTNPATATLAAIANCRTSGIGWEDVSFAAAGTGLSFFCATSSANDSNCWRNRVSSANVQAIVRHCDGYCSAVSNKPRTSVADNSPSISFCRPAGSGDGSLCMRMIL